MNAHPGGSAHTQHMLEAAALPEGARILDLGAGAGEAVAMMRALGYQAAGIDLMPRADFIRPGDLLHTDYESGSFDENGKATVNITYSNNGNTGSASYDITYTG